MLVPMRPHDCDMEKKGYCWFQVACYSAPGLYHIHKKPPSPAASGLFLARDSENMSCAIIHVKLYLSP